MIYRPHAGEIIKADLINAIIDRLESITPKGDGKTIQVKKNPNGITISSFASGGDSVYYSTLTSQVYESICIGDVYQNFDGTYTEEDAIIRIANYLPTPGWTLLITLDFPSSPYYTFQKYWPEETINGTLYPAGNYWTILLDVWR